MSSRLSPAAHHQFRQAVALLQQDRLAAAEALAADLLARFPGDAELAHFGGILANRMARYDTAIERLGRCLALEPGRARSHAALAFAQEKAGRLEAALASFAAAARADPRFAEAFNGLGVVASRLKRHEEAASAFERALALNPRFIEARLNLARALEHLGRSDAAARSFGAAIEMGGDNPEVLRQAAFGLHLAGDYEHGVPAMRRYLENHRDDDMRGQLAYALHKLGRDEEAGEEIERALAGSPGDASVHNVRGSLRRARGDWEGAAAAFARAVELEPGFPEARINLAMAYRHLRRFDDYEREIERAGEHSAGDASALSRLATLHGEAGKARRAIELFEAAIALDPAFAKPHAWLGTELLRAGELERGWREYMYRPVRGAEIFPAIAQGRYPPPIGASPRGKDFALLAEQGLGDMLFFMRYAKPLADAGARLHVVRGDRRLEPLVRRAMAIESWTEGDEVPANVPAIWVGDLPVMARPLVGDVAPTLKIVPLPERVERMRARLPADRRPRIGIAWHAGIPKEESPPGHELLFKAIDVEELGGALAARRAAWIAIQRRPDAGALARLRGKVDVHDLCDANDDLEDMLALLSLLDGYIGVSSTNVHLLAAVGGRAHVLVPHPAEWRWQLAGASPWFPHFSVHRESRDGGWAEALESLPKEIT